MRSLRYPQLWLLPGCLWLIWLCFASLAQVPVDVQISSDKLAHLAAYLVLVYAFGCVLRPRQLPLLLVLSCALGLLLEVLQGFTGYRVFDWGDALANAAGAFLGGLLAWSRFGQLYQQLERRLYA